jgi:NAD kinase
MAYKLPAKFRRFALVGMDLHSLAGGFSDRDLEIVAENPDAVISYGGDGTILHSEQRYPGVPKLCVRDCDSCVRCSGNVFFKSDPARQAGNQLCPSCFFEVLDGILAGKYKIKEEMKLTGTSLSGGRRFDVEALNEIQLHNQNPLHAIRFDLFLNGKEYVTNVISDGVIVSTPYGSTGYFRSVSGGRSFDGGIGIVLNNPTIPRPPLIVKGDLEHFEVRGKVLRRNGLLVADNLPQFVELDAGDEFIIRKSKNVARFFV